VVSFSSPRIALLIKSEFLMFPLSAAWCPITFDLGNILAFLSAAVAVISALIAWRAVTRNLRPVLVFVRDEHKVWFVKNVGTGPALDVLAAEKDRVEQGWQRFKRLPPLPKDGQISLPSAPSFFAVTYNDAENKPYSTICSGYRNRLQKGHVFDKPDEKQIALYPDLPLKDSRS
jgi:hypothetical protein